MKLLLHSPQTLPSIGGLQYVVQYWAVELMRRGHEVTVITDTLEDEGSSIATSPAGDVARKGGVGDNTNNGGSGDDFSGSGSGQNTHLRAGEDSSPQDVSPPAGEPEGAVSPPAGEPEGAVSPPSGGSRRGAVGRGAFLRRASPIAQLRAMRAADKIIMFNVSLKALPLILLSGTPFYVSHHTALWYEEGPKPLRQRIKQWAANYLAKGNCACSGYIAAQYRRCMVVYSPVQVALFGAKNPTVRSRDILFAGRHVSDKGADLLIAALGILHKEGYKLNATLVGSGPETDPLQQQAHALGLLQTDSVVFTGSLSQNDLIKALHIHRMMVVPSRMEPMGMVIAEGLAAGCRMIVARQGGMPEVGGNFCRYFTANDTASLAKAIQEELRHPTVPDPILLKKHLEQFSIGYSVDRLEAFLGGNSK